jgi:hypothetical protein
VKIKILFLLVFLIAARNLHSADLQISDTETDFLFAPEYNRAFKFCWDVSALGRIKLNGLHNIKAGIAMGAVGTVFEMKAFAGGEAALPIGIPLFIGLSYNYNGLEEYDHHIHSLPLLVSFQGKRLSAALGVNFRFVSFLGEPPLFEPILTASLYVAIIDTDFLRLGLKVANFNDFTYDNLGAYFLNLNTVIYLNENLSLLNELELHQSGSIALASNFYGLVYRGGVTISW